MTRIAGAPPKGLFRKYVYRETRKRYDRDLEPMEVMGHSKKLLMAVGPYELMLERMHTVPEKLKALGELELLVIDYAAAMTKTPAEVTDELFTALREHFDSEQMVELTQAIAWEN